MKKLAKLSLLVLVWILLTFTFRHHLRDLHETARTYIDFHAWSAKHTEVLYAPAPAQGHLIEATTTTTTTAASVSNDGQSTRSPRILHQIYLSPDEGALPPAKYDAMTESCKVLHANWTHYLWTTSKADQFMRQHYPDLHPHYIGYRQTIQRANILRYALLHQYGGVYLDLDVQCLQPLDSMLHLPFLTPGAYPAGINNAFILTRPRHPFLQQLLDGAPSRDIRWGLPYVENMLSTGCMYFSNTWMRYVRSTYPRVATTNMTQDEADSRVFILADERGDMQPHMLRGVVTTPLFHHGGASSWHGWDAAAIISIGKHWRLSLLLLLLSCAALFSWILASRSRRFKPGPWPSRASRGRIRTGLITLPSSCSDETPGHNAPIADDEEKQHQMDEMYKRS